MAHIAGGGRSTQMTGEQRVAAPRSTVWDALNDPDVLRAAIPGCQSLAKEGDGFVATVEVKIGPIGARFKGAVTISDAVANEGYTLSGEGSAGIAGSATLVSYEVDSQVAGRLAQLGGPLIDATAKQLAGKFFARFGAVVSGVPAATAPAAAAIAIENAQGAVSDGRVQQYATPTGTLTARGTCGAGSRR